MRTSPKGSFPFRFWGLNVRSSRIPHTCVRIVRCECTQHSAQYTHHTYDMLRHHHITYNDVAFTLNVELNPICHLLALLGAHPILHTSRIRVNLNITLARL